MLLKVGELANRVGLTVRMLHHYDAIGLLKPSARSDGGYRLYGRDDISRLYTIQALRQIGLPLTELRTLLAGTPEPLPAIIQRQILVLEHQVEKAGELCKRLHVLQSSLAQGNDLNTPEWLDTLASMAAYGKYFTAAEIKSLFENWKALESKWRPLVALIHEAMAQGVDPTSNTIQPLARSWINVNMCWVNGNYELLLRWQKMYRMETVAHGRNGITIELVRYIEKATHLRLNVLLKHFTLDELLRFNFAVEDEWIALGVSIDKILRAKTPPNAKRTQTVVSEWRNLMDRTVNHEAVLHQKFLTALHNEPVLRAGQVLNPEQDAFIQAACAAHDSMPSTNQGKKK